MQASWEQRIGRPASPAIPIHVSGMRHTFWVPPRYHRLAARTLTGRRFHIRDMAASLGYSPSGLYHAIESLKEMGIIARVKTVRGRLGYTILLWARDISSRFSGNVPPTDTGESSPKRERRTEEGTFREEVPKGGGYEAWKSLGEVLKGMKKKEWTR